MVRFKLVSSLEKAFLDDNIESFNELKRLSTLRGERISLQLLAYVDEPKPFTSLLDIEVMGKMSGYVTVRNVRHMAVIRPTLKGYDDGDAGYVRTAPGGLP